MGTIKRLVLSRKTAVAIGVALFVAALVSIGIFVADKVAADDPEVNASLSPNWLPSNAIALGAATEEDFAGVLYYSLPELRLCPRSDGRWDGSLLWSGYMPHKNPDPNSSATYRILSGSMISEGQLVLALPSGTTDIKRATVDLNMVQQYADGMSGLPMIGGMTDPPPTVEETFSHKIIRFSPFAGAGVASDDFLVAAGRISFILPALSTRRNGFGDWQFELPFSGQTYGAMTAGLGKARPITSADTGLVLAQDHLDELGADRDPHPAWQLRFVVTIKRTRLASSTLSQGKLTPSIAGRPACRTSARSTAELPGNPSGSS
ncbi:hypothetical protein ACFQZ4_53730 [Catellatospora coxensis]